MKLVERFWATVSFIGSILTLSPFHGNNKLQTSIGNHVTDLQSSVSAPNYPIFFPPSGDPDPDINIQCEYPSLIGWEYCGDVDQSCWLWNANDHTQNYTIYTNYEASTPPGIIRPYTLVLADGEWNADGQIFTEAVLFNQVYPGPWVQACWGDEADIRRKTLQLTVLNRSQKNGTSIHWHGVRQLNSTQMDGVNGVTQCPIAPNDMFIYEFNVTQYGSSWYHSHYSVQYADGALGPMTFHGPSSSPYDIAVPPLLMSDWTHENAFATIASANYLNASILLNGIGNVEVYSGVTPNRDIPTPYTLIFEKGKKYLLRLINTSMGVHFIFSIDGHSMTIIETDFVPIQPYTVDFLQVAIGQRYHVIVQAFDSYAGDGNYWIQTTVAGGRCSEINSPVNPNYNQTGIIRYDPSSTSNPTSVGHQVPETCDDEAFLKTNPIFEWQVPPWDAARDENLTATVRFGKPSGFPYGQAAMEVESFGNTYTPLQIDYSNPMLLNLNNTKGNWPQSWVVVPENYNNEWVYMILYGQYHPIHLHGHDFAILKMEPDPTAAFDPSTLIYDNPVRRDVVQLPGGFAVIAFKTDNPGPWLMHCHIAFHASWGLALQISERQSDANSMWPWGGETITEALRVCNNWNNWNTSCTGGSCVPMEDSGI